MELDTVQLLKALVAELAGEVVVRLRRVLLHVPVQRRALPTLIAADLTPGVSVGNRIMTDMQGTPENMHNSDARAATHCSGVSPVWVRR